MNTLIGFLLFGTVEVFILLMFYKVVGGIKEIKYWHGLILCPILLLLNIFQFPFVKQITSMMLFLIYMMVISDKTLWYKVKIIIASFLYLLVVEMVLCGILEVLTPIDLTKVSGISKFLFLLPIRAVEIMGIYLFYRRKNMGWFWLGSLDEIEEVEEEKETEDEE